MRSQGPAILSSLKFLPFCLVFCGLLPAAERDAFEIQTTLEARHLPYGAVLDPVIENGEIRSYSRAGDSALWTGHYLAAEAYRHRVTGAPEALDNARRTVAALRQLVDVTGAGVLARAIVPHDSPYAEDILSEERHHGAYTGWIGGRPVHWIGNTSRDQYSGVFFGLSVAYELLEHAGLRGEIAATVTAMLDRLIDENWTVVMPDGRISTTFLVRPDQQLTLLQIGRQVNPQRFGKAYRSARLWSAWWMQAPLATEVLDPHGSYFKFNLDTINLFSLVRLEEERGGSRGTYWRAYEMLRRTTDDHGNAHFNMIDCALRGREEGRDAETRELLEAWLRRPRMDEWVDMRGVRKSCKEEDRACEAIPIEERVRTDFLWQRSPFLLYGGGSGRIEGAGIDYLLPYWMARYYGILSD
jgi:hypothetical protein